jgi:thiol-disulfide isomerase/thioredoxin
MKKSTIIVLLFFLVSFLPIPEISLGSEKNEISIDINRSEGYSAFIANEDRQTDDTDDELIGECDCNGSKVIVHGDGHKTPCQCLNSSSGKCECVESQNTWEPDKSTYTEETIGTEEVKKKVDQDANSQTESGKTILYFTASWCGPCRLFKSSELPKLTDAGLTSGEVRNGIAEDIEIVDVDKHRDLWDAYKKGSRGIPCLIVLDSNKLEKFRISGYYSGMYKKLLDAFNAAE